MRRLAAFLLFSLPLAAAADSWEDVVAKSSTRDEAIAALGKPDIEFTAFVGKGEQPLQISPSLPAPPMPGEERDFSEDELVRVLEYPGLHRGLAWQVVLKDDKVWYVIAPPMPDEADLTALAKKHGKAPIQTVDVLRGDLIRTWDLIRYPKKKRVYVREPGAQQILARIVTR